MTARRAALTSGRLLLLATSLLGLAGFGPTQPQSVSGPCRVTQFFIVALGTSHTTMTTSSVPASGDAAAAAGGCSFTLFNPDLQVFQSGALITRPPRHGQAQAGLVQGGRMAELSYRPAPGFVGRDRFTATIEPRDKVVIVAVRVMGTAVPNRRPPGPGGPSPVGGPQTGPAGAIRKED